MMSLKLWIKVCIDQNCLLPVYALQQLCNSMYECIDQCYYGTVPNRRGLLTQEVLKVLSSFGQEMC